MQTLADLKRALKVGASITMVFNRLSESSKTITERLNKARYIVKVNTTGVFLNEDKNAVKGSFMEYPKASLLEFEDVHQGKSVFRIYEPGLRELTEEEHKVLTTRPSDRPEYVDQVMQDMQSDGSTMFYKDREHFQLHDMKYLHGTEKSNGKTYVYHEKKVRDDAVKGELSITYIINN